MVSPEFMDLYQFSGLKKWRYRLRLGPGSIFPAPSPEKSAPYDSNPAVAGTGPLALHVKDIYAPPFQRTKVLHEF